MMTKIRISLRTAVFVANATVIRSLGHGLRTSTAVPRSAPALHPSGVAKSSTGFDSGKGGDVTSAGWQVTLCDPV